jgi:hypothetical protein
MERKTRSPASRLLFCAPAALLAAALAAGCGQARTNEAGAGAAKWAAMDSARFQATLYEVCLPPAKVGELDARALAAGAATAADLEKTLARFGKTKALYQVDQAVNPARDAINLSTRVPLVTGSRAAEGGRTINTVQYQQVGALFEFLSDKTAAAERRGAEIQLRVEIAALADTGIAIAEGVKATAVRSSVLTYKGPVEPGKPFVFFSADASSKDADGSAVAYVCRAVLGDAKP